MKFIGLAIGALHGLLVVGILALIEAIVAIFAEGWQMPFSIWWGLLFSLPGLAFAAFPCKHRM